MTKRRAGLVTLRRVIGGACLFIGLFVACFGVGNGQPALIVTGLVVMALAAATTTRVAGGFRRPVRPWIRGSAEVVEVSAPPADVEYGRCSLEIVVDAPGLPRDPVLLHLSRVPVALWPRVGQRLPVDVAGDDVRNVRIRWQEVAAGRDLPAGTGGGGLPADGHHQAPADRTDPPDGAGGEHDPDRQPVDFDLDEPPPPLPPTAGPDDPPGEDRSFGAEALGEETATPAPDSPADRPPGRALVPRPRSGSTEPPTDHRPGPGPVPAPDPAGQEEHGTDRPHPPVEPVTGAAGTGLPPATGADPDAAPGEPERPDRERPGSDTADRERTGQDRSAAGSAGVDPPAPADDGAVTDLVTTYPSAHPGPAGPINGIGLTVLVGDLTRSISFYRDTLGFYEVDRGDGTVVLASGATRLLLRQADDLGAVRHRLVHLNLEVADLDRTYEELREGGVRFTYPPRPVSTTTRLELWAAAFRDPDGHGVALTQWRPATRDSREPLPSPDSPGVNGA